MSITKPQQSLDELHSVLSSFHIITLQEIEQSHLMSRFDEKYIFRISKLREFLVHLLPHYKILSVHRQVMALYENIYFDTIDLKSYHDHHNERANRYKIRFRNYSDSGDCYFEIKKKDNRGYTNKVRQRAAALRRRLSDTEIDFVKSNLSDAELPLQPSLSNSFNRITLVNTQSRERLTIDILTYFKNEHKEKRLDELVIAEVKQEQHFYDSVFKRLMQQQRIFPVSFSKYCIGTLLTHPGIKYNRFKPKLTVINNLCNEPA